jgi:hypothetical protein
MMIDGTVVMVSMVSAISLIIGIPIAMGLIAERGVEIIIGIQVIGFVSNGIALSIFRLLITLVGKWYAIK